MRKLMKFLPVILVFAVYVVFRTTFCNSSFGINDIELKSLGLLNSGFPFGVLKETLLSSSFFPFYYILISPFYLIFKSIGLIHLLNSIISFLTIIFAFLLAKKVDGVKFALLVGVLFSINHFFFYYSNLISPYSLLFLLGIILLNALYDYLKNPIAKNLRLLLIINILFILVDKTAILYLISEIIVLYLIKNNKHNYKKAVLPLITALAFGLIFSVPFLTSQILIGLKALVPSAIAKIGLNFNGLYLVFNEYLSPYLSFSAGDEGAKTTLGMLYTFFLNPDIKNINSLKLFLTLLYSSILPLVFAFWFSFKAYLKNFKLSVILKIALLNLVFVSILAIFQIIDLKPIYITQLFLTFVIVFAYGLFLIKDKFLKYLFILSFILIQVITPKINSFDIVIDRKYPTIDVFNQFLSDYPSASNVSYIIPYLGHSAKLYFKDLDIIEFDNDRLILKGNNSLISQYAQKNNEKLNKKTILPLSKMYLSDLKTNTYVLDFLTKSVYSKDLKTVIVFVDKLNSRPISKDSIERCAHLESVNNNYALLSFKNPQNSYNSQNKLLINSIKSKTLYDMLKLLDSGYYVHSLVQYKKIDNTFQKVQNQTLDIYRELNSYSSDYVFIIFGKMPT